MKRVKGDILGFRQVELAERHRNCLPRGGVTFREFYGPGPAEGAGQTAELNVELLHRSFHHRYVIHWDRMLECSRVSQLYSPLGGPGCSWSMGADKKDPVLDTHGFMDSYFSPALSALAHPTTSCCDGAVHSGGCSQHSTPFEIS